MTGQGAAVLGGWVLSVGGVTGAAAVATVSVAKDAGRLAREAATDARLRWTAWRLRYAPVPQDGAYLTAPEMGRWAGLLRAWGDKAGTRRVAAAEAAIEEALREAGARAPGKDGER
jgi:cytosine/adenosine deaminase-related metal-dependent hydrolase